MANGKKKKKTVTGELGLAARATRTALSRNLTRLGIHPGQDTVLLALAKEDGIALSALAERLSVKPPTVTKTIARLTTQGLVEKRASPEDGRRHHAHLTERGQGVLRSIAQARRAIEDAAVRDFSKKERKLLRKMLARVGDNLAAVEPAAASADRLDA